MRKKIVYLDCAAATPLDKNALAAMLPFLKGEFGNPSSAHSLGQRARASVEKAREQVASFLGCSANEIIFTSGATEANTLAIRGIAEGKKKPHVITSEIEHESVLVPIQNLEKLGGIEATYIAPDKEGRIRAVHVGKALRENTALVSLQYANSEIGTIQPIAEVGKLLQGSGAVFHCDAVQAANFLSCSVAKLRVDLLTLSSHKIYGPKGAGALYVREGTQLSPVAAGGGQEQGMRSGTENVAGIAGMGEAVSELQNPKAQVQNIRIRQLRDALVKEVLSKIPHAELAGSQEHRLPNNALVLFEGIEGRDAVQLLDQRGVAVSTGSACSERSQEPSHVLLALGYSSNKALSAVRFSLGKYTAKKEVLSAVKALGKAVEQLRGKA